MLIVSALIKLFKNKKRIYIFPIPFKLDHYNLEKRQCIDKITYYYHSYKRSKMQVIWEKKLAKRQGRSDMELFKKEMNWYYDQFIKERKKFKSL